MGAGEEIVVHEDHHAEEEAAEEEIETFKYIKSTPIGTKTDKIHQFGSKLTSLLTLLIYASKAINFLISAIARPGLSPLGHVLAQSKLPKHITHNCVASVDAERVLQFHSSFNAKLITRINHPSIRLHQHRRPQVLIATLKHPKYLFHQ